MSRALHSSRISKMRYFIHFYVEKIAQTSKHHFKLCFIIEYRNTRRHRRFMIRCCVFVVRFTIFLWYEIMKWWTSLLSSTKTLLFACLFHSLDAGKHYFWSVLTESCAWFCKVQPIYGKIGTLWFAKSLVYMESFRICYIASPINPCDFDGSRARTLLWLKITAKQMMISFV